MVPATGNWSGASTISPPTRPFRLSDCTAATPGSVRRKRLMVSARTGAPKRQPCWAGPPNTGCRNAASCEASVSCSALRWSGEQFALICAITSTATNDGATKSMRGASVASVCARTVEATVSIICGVVYGTGSSEQASSGMRIRWSGISMARACAICWLASVASAPRSSRSTA